MNGLCALVRHYLSLELHSIKNLFKSDPANVTFSSFVTDEYTENQMLNDFPKVT